MSADAKAGTRSPLPLEQWPAVDHEAWTRATSAGGLMDDAGEAADWGLPTTKSRRNGYGRWLMYLSATGQLDADEHPFRRAHRLLSSYIDALKERGLETRSVWSYVDNIGNALRVMFPDRQEDIAWIRKIVNRLKRVIIPARRIEPDLVHPKRLYRASRALMESAEALYASDPILAAVRFRDGLLLAFQTACQLRLRNLAMIRIGKHLLAFPSFFWIKFKPEETKAHKPIEKQLPSSLTRSIQRYLEHYRPILLQGRSSDVFWINQYGAPLSYWGVNRRLAIITKRKVKRTLRSHRFRHCAASYMAIEMPERAAAIPALLDNSLAAAEGYYIRGQQIAASRWYADLIEDLRKNAQEAQGEEGNLDPRRH